MKTFSVVSGDFLPSANVRISLFDLDIFLDFTYFPRFSSLPIFSQYLYEIKRPKCLWILEAKAPLISVLSGYFHKTPRREGSLSPLTRPRPLLLRCSILFHYIFLYLQTLSNFANFLKVPRDQNKLFGGKLAVINNSHGRHPRQSFHVSFPPPRLSVIHPCCLAADIVYQRRFWSLAARSSQAYAG